MPSAPLATALTSSSPANSRTAAPGCTPRAVATAADVPSAMTTDLNVASLPATAWAMRSFVIVWKPDQKLTTGTRGTSASTGGGGEVGVGATVGAGVAAGGVGCPLAAEAGLGLGLPEGFGWSVARAAWTGLADGRPSTPSPAAKPTTSPATAMRMAATAIVRARLPDQ